MTPKEIDESACARKLKVLAEATRLSVLRLLMQGPMHVGELNAELGIDQSLLSHHLSVLREADLVVAVRDGRAILYRLAPGVEISGPGQGIDLGCCQLSLGQ